LFAVGIVVFYGCSSSGGPDSGNGEPPDTTDGVPDTTEAVRPDSTGPGVLTPCGYLNIFTNGTALGLAKEDNYLFIGDGNYIKVVDVANPSLPGLVSSFPNPSYDAVAGIGVEGNRVYGVFENKLKIFDIGSPVSPVELSSLTLTYSGARGIAICGNYAFIGRRGMGVSIVDISNPSDPIELDVVTDYQTYSLTIGAGRLFVGEETGFKVWRLDIADPDSLVQLGATYPTGETAFDMDYFCEHLFLAAGKSDEFSSTGIFTVLDKHGLIEVFTDTTQYICKGVAVEGNYAYVIDADVSGASNLYVYETFNPANTYRAHTQPLPAEARAVLADDGYIYVLCVSRLMIYRHQY